MPFSRLLLLLIISIGSVHLYAQTSVINTTVGNNFSNNDGNGLVIFNFQNNNSYDVIITDIEAMVSVAGSTTADVWISNTPLSGNAYSGGVSTTTGWSLAARQTFVGVANTTTLNMQPIITGASITIPANSIYAICIAAYNGTAGRLRYHTMVAPNIPATTISAGGCSILMGNGNAGTLNNTSFGAPALPSETTATYSNAKAFIGKISFFPALACTTPPDAGMAIASPATPICPGSNVLLNLVGNSTGLGQTYIWQKSTNAAPPYSWSDITTSSTVTQVTVTPSSTALYRVAVTCGSATVYSDSVEVIVNQGLAGGSYSINGNLPTSGTNFQTFSDAVNAMACGILGPVTFNVEPMTYNEQFTIPAIAGTSTINTVKFKGNLATLSFNSTSSTNKAGIWLNGADHIIIDSLNIDGAAGTYAWGIVLTNQADSNIISNCNIVVSKTSIVSGEHMGIAINGSPTSTAVAGNNGNGNLIENNTFTGGFTAIYFHSSTSLANKNNVIKNNIIKDFYYYSISVTGQESCLISGNDISRPTRSNFSSYNVFVGANNGGILIEKNKMHDLFQNGSGITAICYNIYIVGSGTSTKPNSVENNLVYSINNSNGTIYGIYAAGYNYWNYYHNTIVLDDPTSTAGGTYGIYVYGTAGTNVKNNLVSITRAGNGIKYCLYYATAGVTSSNNNVLYMGSVAGTNGIGYFNFGRTTLTSWKTTGFDLNSFSKDPLFIGSGNYTPTEPVINNIGAGALGVTTDINEVTRYSVPDPGAIEFNITGTDATINWIAPITPAPPGANTVTVTISNYGSSIINTVSLSYSDGTTLQTQSFNGLNIAPAFSQNLSFSTLYNVAGNIKFTAYINTVNGAIDVNQLNDTITQNLCIALSGNYTINKNAPASSTNFASFSDAFNALSCGGADGPVVFKVVPGSGPYSEPIVIPQFRGASSTNTVTVKGSLETIYYKSSDANSKTAVIFNGADYVILDSLNINVSEGAYGWGIVLTNQADSNVIRNCNIITSVSSITTDYMGIQINGSATAASVSGNNGNGNLIENNTITGGYTGINIYGSTSTYNINNTVSNNTVKDFYYYSIYLFGQQSATVSKNDVYRPARTTFSSYCLFIAANNGGIKVEKNRIHDLLAATVPRGNTQLYPVYLNGSGTAANLNYFQNNLVYNINMTDGRIWGVYGFGNYWNYYHNTIVLDEAAATTGITYGLYVDNSSGQTVANVKNNIIYIARGGTGTKYCLYYPFGITASNNNVLWMGSTSGINGIGLTNSLSYTTLANWQTANSNLYDQQSISLNPVFANVGASPADYTPTASGVNNTGTALGVTQDILDKPRSTTAPDPGAYEFSTPFPVTFLDLKADKHGTVNRLTWQTLTEDNNAGFEVQRSSDGINFSKLTFIVSKAINGNSTAQLHYIFDDTQPLTVNAYYRLKQLDKDGKFSYSNIVMVNGIKANEVTINNVYPIPANEKLYLNVNAPLNKNLIVLVSDVTGKILIKQPVSVVTGNNTIKADISKLASGMYILKLSCEGGCEAAIVRFIKN